jgi:alpha-mannosidase II
MFIIAEVKFGTMGEYFRTVEKLKPNFPLLSGDFFPYNDAGGDYWVGYFTSRPFLKRNERILQVTIDYNKYK